MRVRLDGMTLAGVAVLMLFAVNIVRGWAGEGNPEAAPTNMEGTPVAVMTAVPESLPPRPMPATRRPIRPGTPPSLSPMTSIS